MKATQIYRKREMLPNGLLIEAVVWHVPKPVPGCAHSYKYRLYAGRAGQCLVRYDNERDKGDHKHIGAVEAPYAFMSVDRLMADFIDDVNRLGG